MTRSRQLDPSKLQELHELRELTLELDRRVTPIVEAAVSAALIPIVIGGGHNNALPILRGVSRALGRPLDVSI